MTRMLSDANARGAPTGFCAGRWRAAVVLVLLVAVGLTAAPAQAAFPGSNGKIAFTRAAPTLGGDIWTMDPDGLNQAHLTTVDAADENPAFSPDGQKIAFMSRRDASNAEIYVMNADGTGQTRLTTNAATDDNPAFSGNGSRIAFETNRDGNTEIYMMNANGTGAVNLTNNTGAADEAPALSPDGRKIAFRSLRDNPQGEIYVMDTDGSNQRRLTTNSIVDDDPSFSPNGTKIAFSKGNQANPGNVWVMNAVDGSSERQLSTTTYPSDTRDPSFSPAGADIALVHTGGLFDPPTDQEINTMPAVGGALTNRSLSPGTADFAPDWGPQPGTTPARPSVSIGNASVTESDSGELDASVTVSLSATSNTVVEVDFATADDTATTASDYIQAKGTVTFAPGETTKSVTVKVKGDTVQEPDERFFVNLSNPRGATNGTMQGVVNIIDNDASTTGPPVDTTPPQTTITAGPSGTTNDSTPTFTFSSDEPNSTFACRVDAAAFASCTSPHTTATLTDGEHTFEVRATDGAGNADPTPAIRTFTVDTTAPQTTIDSGPTGTTSDNTPTFEFSSSETGSSFECKLDTGSFAACTSPHTTAPLADGSHTFEVRATDGAGNVDQPPASRTFTVSTAASPPPSPPSLLPPPPGQAQAPDTTRPLIGAMSLSRTRFRVAGSGPSIATALGTRVSYALSEPASVSFRVERALSGRRVGGRCVRTTRTNRRARSCTRYSVLRGGFAHSGKAGQNAFKFSGRLGGRKLAPGRYRLRGLATDKAGNKSLLKRTGFRIVRR